MIEWILADMQGHKPIEIINLMELIFIAGVGAAITALLHAELNGAIGRLGKHNKRLRSGLERLLYALVYTAITILAAVAARITGITGG